MQAKRQDDNNLSNIIEKSSLSLPAPKRSDRKNDLSLPEIQKFTEEVDFDTAKAMEDSRISALEEEEKMHIIDYDTAQALDKSRLSVIEDIERRTILAIDEAANLEQALTVSQADESGSKLHSDMRVELSDENRMKIALNRSIIESDQRVSYFAEQHFEALRRQESDRKGAGSSKICNVESACKGISSSGRGKTGPIIGGAPVSAVFNCGSLSVDPFHSSRTAFTSAQQVTARNENGHCLLDEKILTTSASTILGSSETSEKLMSDEDGNRPVVVPIAARGLLKSACATAARDELKSPAVEKKEPAPTEAVACSPNHVAPAGIFDSNGSRNAEVLFSNRHLQKPKQNPSAEPPCLLSETRLCITHAATRTSDIPRLRCARFTPAGMHTHYAVLQHVLNTPLLVRREKLGKLTRRLGVQSAAAALGGLRLLGQEGDVSCRHRQCGKLTIAQRIWGVLGALSSRVRRWFRLRFMCTSA